MLLCFNIITKNLKNGSWQQEEQKYVNHLLSIVDQFAPGASDLVEDTFALHPQKMEDYFGLSQGHIHHLDNGTCFDKRAAYKYPIDGLFSCSAGCHPGGSVIGAAGHNSAMEIIKELN